MAERAKSWDDLARRIDRAAVRLGDGIIEAVEDSFGDFGRRWVNRMEARVTGTYSPRPKSAGSLLASRGGALRRGFIYAVIRVDGSVSVRLSNRERYWSTHELGTKGAGGELPTIRPKRAQALTIPLEAALTKSGRPKQGKARARDWDDLFVFRFPQSSDVDEAFLARDTDNGDLELIFRLAKKVDVPPRLGGRKALADLVTERLIPRLSSAIDRLGR